MYPPICSGCMVVFSLQCLNLTSSSSPPLPVVRHLEREQILLPALHWPGYRADQQRASLQELLRENRSPGMHTCHHRERYSTRDCVNDSSRSYIVAAWSEKDRSGWSH